MLPDSFNEVLDQLNFSDSDRTLLAVSGGVDSVVLAHLYAGVASPGQIGIAHVNFNLRGHESDQDAAMVGRLAANLGVQFHLTSADTKKYATENGISTQMAARDLRYDWFRQLARDFNYTRIATAHHLNDSLETSLFNLVRGTGLAGLRGIPESTHGILRPLINTSRDEILAYATSNGLTWREDASNADDAYRRNFIRHHVIPHLKSLNPSLEDTFRSTRERLRDSYCVLQAEAERRRRLYQHEKGTVTYIDLAAFADGNIAVAEELLQPYGCNFQQVSSLLKALNNHRGTMSLMTSGFFIVKDRTDLVISPNSEELPEIALDKEGGEWDHPIGKISAHVSVAESGILTGDMQATFDYEKLKNPLILRKWKHGDWIRPLGLGGKKKVSDLMIDEKIPLNLKERVCVLESAGELIWVIGLRISDNFKVRPGTSKYLNIIIEDDQSV